MSPEKHPQTTPLLSPNDPLPSTPTPAPALLPVNPLSAILQAASLMVSALQSPLSVLVNEDMLWHFAAFQLQASLQLASPDVSVPPAPHTPTSSVPSSFPGSLVLTGDMSGATVIEDPGVTLPSSIPPPCTPQPSHSLTLPCIDTVLPSPPTLTPCFQPVEDDMAAPLAQVDELVPLPPTNQGMGTKNALRTSCKTLHKLIEAWANFEPPSNLNSLIFYPHAWHYFKDTGHINLMDHDNAGGQVLFVIPLCDKCTDSSLSPPFLVTQLISLEDDNPDF
ncbi:hypothetical protein BKA82DRAFT_23550 [Pisolithus tinctorius]|uniref:Uncharacterized protein n=1 Tax=Pisolithus tinctorius Marx 270 TaxID=870435 RepID=A0A0C3P3Q7_PISTI|nr:hypothetical protein BKA82DRAFT_23550 [Pisolithus tinctorius]KIO07675.1 hypothetical protein M404DRAFT_23550 [Pisolithus tinctorius Marx 270]